jgi:hypothetical protein
MIDPRNVTQRQPDVVEHTMIDAARRGPVFRVVRLVKRGPLVPFGLMYVESRREPGTDNDMTGTRSPHLAGFLSGEPVPHEELPRLFASGKAGSRHILQAEYARLVAEIASNRRAGRYDARTEPRRPVDIGQVELPFARARAG